MADTPPTQPAELVCAGRAAASSIPRAPRGLDKAGKELWKSIHAVFDFKDEPGRAATSTIANSPLAIGSECRGPHEIWPCRRSFDRRPPVRLRRETPRSWVRLRVWR